METETTPSKQPETERTWVWYSTVESAAAGKISVLAVTETAVLTIVGFWLLYEGWVWHLLFGLFVAPLFYLRTEESTQAALDWAKFYLNFLFNKEENYKERFWYFWGSWVFLVVFSLFEIYFLAMYFLSVWFEIPSDFLVDFFIGFIATSGMIIMIIVVVVVVLGMWQTRNEEKKVEITTGIASVTLIIAVAMAIEGEITGSGIVTGAIIAIILISVLSLIIVAVETEEQAELMVGMVPLLYFLFGVVMLVLFLFVRIFVGTYFFINRPFQSLRTVRYNWAYHHFSLDSFYPPELLPNAEQKEEFEVRISDIISMSINLAYKKYFIFAIRTTLFFPAFLFRYSMKMGAWIWLPLVWLFQPHQTKEPNAFLAAESTEFWAHFRLVYSLFILVFLTLGGIALASELKRLGLEQQALAVIFLFGFAKFWTWTRAATAALFIPSYFISRHIRIRRAKGENPNYGEFWIAKLRHIFWLRKILALFTLGVSLYLITTEMVDWELVRIRLAELELLPGFFLQDAREGIGQ